MCLFLFLLLQSSGYDTHARRRNSRDHFKTAEPNPFRMFASKLVLFSFMLPMSTPCGGRNVYIQYPLLRNPSNHAEIDRKRNKVAGSLLLLLLMMNLYVSYFNYYLASDDHIEESDRSHNFLLSSTPLVKDPCLPYLT